MIIIVGAGPVGCYATSLLAEKFDVTVIEEHKKIGVPVQCTGIVTQEIFDFIPRKNNFIINEVNDVRIFSPNNKHTKLRLEQPDIILDRVKFDNYFYEKAVKSKATFLFNHRFLSIESNGVRVKDLGTKKIKLLKSDYIIGADGPLSAVAKEAGLFNKRKFFIGIQAVVKKKNNNIIDFYPVKNGFGWAVPEDKNTLRVGVASRENPNEFFNYLLRKYKGKIVEKQGGLIPLFNPWSNFSKDKIFLVGDAAGFVKVTTGGGLIPGLRSAQIIADSLNKGRSYDAGVYFKLFPNLLLNLEMRKVMDDFKPEEWNELIKELNNPKSKKCLEKINRDKIFELMLKLGTNKPDLLLKHGLKHFTSFF